VKIEPTRTLLNYIFTFNIAYEWLLTANTYVIIIVIPCKTTLIMSALDLTLYRRFLLFGVTEKCLQFSFKFSFAWLIELEKNQ
jgi:hypothetical protein